MQNFFARGSSAPARVEQGGPATWLVGTPVAPSVQGHGLPPLQEYGPIRVFFFFFFFEPLVAGDQKASLASLSPWLRPFRHLEGSLAWGPSL